ncbi:MAG TPA: TPM domain-containing protein [Puia sp.]
MLLIRYWCFVCCLVSAQPLWAAVRDTIPRPVGYVSDFEHLFTPGQVDTLDELLHAYEKRTTIEIAIITVDSSLTKSADFDFFVPMTMEAWGVGKKETKNGVMIGVSRMFRKIRIQNGAGIEKVMPNADTKKIIAEAFIPFFKKGQYYEGVLNGLKTLMQRLE